MQSGRIRPELLVQDAPISASIGRLRHHETVSAVDGVQSKEDVERTGPDVAASILARTFLQTSRRPSRWWPLRAGILQSWESPLASRSAAIELARRAMTAPSAARRTLKARVQKALLSSITVERLAWGGLVVLAVLTRFWELGAQGPPPRREPAFLLFLDLGCGQGRPTRMIPLMHGPLLFHLNALVYLLFGASDATSRYAPALPACWSSAALSAARTEVPRSLGSVGHQRAAPDLADDHVPEPVHPARIYTVAGALLMFICIVRYVDQPRAQMAGHVPRNHCADAGQPRDHLRDHRPVRLVPVWSGHVRPAAEVAI